MEGIKKKKKGKKNNPFLPNLGVRWGHFLFGDSGHTDVSERAHTVQVHGAIFHSRTKGSSSDPSISIWDKVGVRHWGQVSYVCSGSTSTPQVITFRPAQKNQDPRITVFPAVCLFVSQQDDTKTTSQISKKRFGVLSHVLWKNPFFFFFFKGTVWCRHLASGNGETACF